jgi:uncharacterized protein
MSKRTGTSDLPLHYGSAPPWLFKRMKGLAREVICVMASEYGIGEFLRRVSDPYWFQAFGCVLGFDWHSSGVTTTVCGAVKEAVRGLEDELGLYVAGGKGAASRKTPAEIEQWCERLGRDPAGLVYSSRMSAKVDSAAVQDGYQIYHHLFLFTRAGDWGVIQQGMNTATGYARRYHWLGERVVDFVCEPHSAVCCDATGETVNLVAAESGGARDTSAGLARHKPELVIADIRKMQSLALPCRHELLVSDINPERLGSILLSTYESQPPGFGDLLGMKGVGAKTIRALALVSELVYGEAPSTRDPARFSFAHGGKDGYPYPVDRATYDSSIEFLADALRQARVERSEKLAAFRRLHNLSNLSR